jgi:hypothetical protein
MPKYGAIYIAHNPVDGKNVFKVGKTNRTPDVRMTELTADTTNMGIYKEKAWFVVNDIDAAENVCHKRLKQFRIQPNREFFELELSRLISIVEEVTATFKAENHNPSLSYVEGEGFSENPSSNLTIIEKIKLARHENTQQGINYENSIQEAKLKIEQYFSTIQPKVIEAKHNLDELGLVKWDIPENLETAKNFGTKIDFYLSKIICSATIHSKFIDKKPLSLPIKSKLRGMPKDWWHGYRRHGGDQFFEWIDDGRVGGIYIWASVGISRNESQGNSERRRLKLEEWRKEKNLPLKQESPKNIKSLETYKRICNYDMFKRDVLIKQDPDLCYPRLQVSAFKFCYDDQRKDLNRLWVLENYYLDPMAAFEIFQAMIINNLVVEQHDVRVNVDKDGQHHIVDRGKFSSKLLKIAR